MWYDPVFKVVTVRGEEVKFSNGMPCDVVARTVLSSKRPACRFQVARGARNRIDWFHAKVSLQDPFPSFVVRHVVPLFAAGRNVWSNDTTSTKWVVGELGFSRCHTVVLKTRNPFAGFPAARIKTSASFPPVFPPGMAKATLPGEVRGHAGNFPLFRAGQRRGIKRVLANHRRAG